jgi:hypothetical protein
MNRFFKNNKVIILGLILVFSLSSLTNSYTPKDKYTSIELLSENGSLKTIINGLGNYQGDCIEFDLQNTISDTLFVEIEPGRRLISKDTTIQDILIVKRKRFKIFPRMREKLKGNGFCCQSNNHSPYENAKFDVGCKADSNWVKLAEFINVNDFPTQATQSAIWVLSDNHPLSSVHADDLSSIYPLRKIVAEIKGVEIPWYSLTYKADTARLFSNRPKNIYGNFKYRVKNNSVITISVRNKNGAIVKTLVAKEAKGPGEYIYRLNMNVEKWKKGEYSIYVYQDYSKQIVRKKFVL